MKQCPHCSQVNSDLAIYCQFCGKGLGNKSVLGKKRSSCSTFGLVFGILSILGGLLVLVLVFIGDFSSITGWTAGIIQNTISTPTSMPTSSPTLSPASTPTISPSIGMSSCQSETASFLMTIQPIMQEFTSEIRAASSTDGNNLDLVIHRMEALRKTVESVSAPSCAENAHNLLLSSMTHALEIAQNGQLIQRSPDSERLANQVMGELNLSSEQLIALMLGQPTPASLSEVIPIPTEEVITELVLPTLTPVPQFVGTEAEFRAYLIDKYSVIDGNPLEIEDVQIHVKEGDFALRAVTIELTSESALYVFANQTREAATEYGRSLLRDTISFFGGLDCSAYVSDNFDTFELSENYFDDDWYYIGDFDLDDGWYISKDYIIAHFLNGKESIDVWNYK